MTDQSRQCPEISGLQPFAERLKQQQLELVREHTTTLQINTGLRCDLGCRHCHLEAGPQRTESMSRATMAQVIEHARQRPYPTIDITGGAPELVPDLPFLIEQLAPLCKRLMLRTNLTALNRPNKAYLLDLIKQHKVCLVASFPATNAGQLEAQRGSGVMDSSLQMLKRLNEAGYGIAGSGLQLDLVANPSGAFMPTGQEQAEKKFKRDLARKWGLQFNQLYIFANMPLGRFRRWLQDSENLHAYMHKLAAGFNPCTCEGLMCRSLLSVNWDGYQFDCDFNLAADLPLGGTLHHISELDDYPLRGSAIAVGEHCYACTAGTGFT